MKQGVLLFAHDNHEISYTKIAAWSAQRIKRWLDLPVCLVTDKPCPDPVFDHVITQAPQCSSESRYFADLDRTVAWFNHDRCQAFDLSPFDQTILLDVDYVVAGNELRSVLDIPTDIATPRWAYDVTAMSDLADLNYFGHHRMPVAWATMVMFRKTNAARMVFDMMAMIKTHWHHYRNLYHLTQSKYRNDFALAIALNTVYGHQGTWPEIPWRLATIEPQHRLTQLDTDSFRVDYVLDGKPRWISLQNMDFHAMGKSYLGDIVANQG